MRRFWESRAVYKEGKDRVLERERNEKSTGKPCFFCKRESPQKRGGEEKAYSKLILVLSPMVTEVVFSFPSRT